MHSKGTIVNFNNDGESYTGWYDFFDKYPQDLNKYRKYYANVKNLPLNTNLIIVESQKHPNSHETVYVLKEPHTNTIYLSGMDNTNYFTIIRNLKYNCDINSFNFEIPKYFSAIRNEYGNYNVTYDEYNFHCEDKKIHKEEFNLRNVNIKFEIKNSTEEELKIDDSETVYKKLLPLGINIKYDDNQYKPPHEVMLEIAKYIKKIRSALDEVQFEIQRKYILQSLVGCAYASEFLY